MDQQPLINNVKGKYDLWRTDGTPQGTQRLKTPSMSDCVITAIASAGDRYYYCQQRLGYDGIFYLCVSQGGILDTHTIATINSPAAAIAGIPSAAFFLVEENATRVTLHRASGDGYPYTFDSVWTFEERSGGKSRSMVATTTHVYFVIYPIAGGAELWRSDGSQEGTQPVCVTNGQGPSHLIVFNDQVIFSADEKAKKAKPIKAAKPKK